MTYTPPQNILAAILQSRKQGAYNDPGVPLQQAQMPQSTQSQGHLQIDPMQILNGFLGTNPPQTQQQPSALSALATTLQQPGQAMQSIPGAQAPINPMAQLTGIGNPNQSNGQNIGMMLAKLFGGG